LIATLKNKEAPCLERWQATLKLGMIHKDQMSPFFVSMLNQEDKCPRVVQAMGQSLARAPLVEGYPMLHKALVHWQEKGMAAVPSLYKAIAATRHPDSLPFLKRTLQDPKTPATHLPAVKEAIASIGTPQSVSVLAAEARKKKEAAAKAGPPDAGAQAPKEPGPTTQ
jgi:hypothetical protein